VRKAKEAKHWARYQRDKQLKIFARDTLIAALAHGGMLMEGEVEAVVPEPLKQRNDKGRSRGAKLRRQARFASAAARCYSVEMDDEEIGGHACQLDQSHGSEAQQPSAPKGRVQSIKRDESIERGSSDFSALDATDAPAAALPNVDGKQGTAKRQSKQCSVM